MARVPPKGGPLKRRFVAGHLDGLEPPKITEAPANIVERPSSGYKDLNFKVDPALHQTFKLEAVKRGKSNVDLLKDAFWFYVKNHPIEE